MNPAAIRSRLPGAWSPYLPALGALLALLGYVLFFAFPPARAEMPVSAPLAAGAFALFQLVFPVTRPCREHILSPLNWAVFAFFLQLVVMPLTIVWAGMESGTLPHLPGMPFVEKSMLLSIVSFGAFSCGYALSARAGRGAAPAEPPRLPPWLIAAYVAVGIAGILLRFGSFGSMFATLADPGKFAAAPAEADSFQAAASTFLRPFVIGGSIMAWCVWIERRGAQASALVRLLSTLLVAVAVILVGATYAINRGSFIVPLVALAAAYSVHVRRLSIGALGTTAALLLLLAIVSGQYRSGEATTAELVESRQKREDVLVPKELGAEVQVYASAPQFAAFLLEAGERGEQRFSPRVLLASLLYPVPILGKPFRDESGPAIYNRLIYGEADILDQIIPFEAEVWLCLGPSGLLLAFLALGIAMARLQRAFDRAQGAFDSYAVQFMAVWAGFLIQGSLAVVSQVFVFFGWPIYTYLLLRPWLRSSVPGSSEPAGERPGDVAPST